MTAPIDPGSLGDLFRFMEGRDLLGRLAVLGGLVTEAQLEDCLAGQRSSSDATPLGEILLARKLVTPEQLAELRRQEAELQRLDEWGDAPPEAGSGRVVGRYLLARMLGAGQAGVVWKAWDMQLQRWVALKEAKEDGAFPRERFLREARAAAKIRHPNLIEALEVGRQEGRDYLVMSYVEGRPLDEVLLAPPRAAEILADVAAAVHSMHGAGILHRDLKPSNILLDAQGRPHLGDFGVARDLSGPRLTMEGTILGTPAYMAPEQASGQQDRVKATADVYGLGATLYHLLTGRPPFQAGDDLQELLQRLSRETPLPPRQVNASIPPDLEVIVLKAMEKHPSDRYPSAAAMEEDLRRFLRGEPLRARPAGPAARALKWLRRNPRIAAAAVLVAAAASFLLVRSSRDETYHREYQEGVELWSRQLPQEAMARFEAAARSAPGRPEPLLMRGRCLALLGRTGEADEAWSEALRIDPSYGPALFELGKRETVAYVLARLQPPARASGGRLRFGPAPPETDAQRARREKGEALLSRALSAPGLDPEALRFIAGALAFGQGHYEEAAAALRDYALRNRWDALAAELFGAASYLTGRFPAAEEALSRAIGLHPSPERYRARGDTRYALGKYAGAVEDYGRVEGDPEVLCNRGLALQAQGKLAEAIADYGRAIELRPGLARAYNNRGTARAELLDLAGAQKDFELALERNEFYADAYLHLGNTLLLQNQPDAAIQQYDIAVKVDPRMPEALVQRARARRRRQPQDVGGAVADYEASLGLDPANPDVLLELATAQEAKGERAKAAASLRRALEVGQDSWSLRDRAAKLLSEWNR